MLLLILIALGQLALLVMILAAVTDGPQVDVSPSERIRALERQTVDALLRTSAQVQAEDDWTGHYYHPGQ